jgi:hydroxybutyrate-dimer hydrolase
LDIMLAHLRQGAALPPSQVVHTAPRGIDEYEEIPDLTAKHLPRIQPEPDTGARITFDGCIVYIPE